MNEEDLVQIQNSVRDILLRFPLSRDSEGWDLREGLSETPQRVTRMYEELLSGYGQDPKEILNKTFEEFGLLSEYGRNDELIVVKGIPFFSLCEHHLLPFMGEVHIGYLKKRAVVGLSKLPRLVEVFSRRLQLQERMTEQISESLFNSKVKPEGVIVLVQAVHTCVIMRGVRARGSDTVTLSTQGEISDNVRAEFFRIIDRDLRD